MSDRDIAFEFHRFGSSVKVTAIDMMTGKEVSMIGSAATPKPLLQRMAMQKLIYVLNKEKEA